MTEHSPLRAAAITEAAKAAGAYDPADAVVLIPATETLNPSEAVAALKAMRPHLFRPKQARDMTAAERDAALRAAGVNPATIRRK
jgi:hypothetical protein